MSPRARRILIPIVVAAAAVSIALIAFFGSGPRKPSPVEAPADVTATVDDAAQVSAADETAQAPDDEITAPALETEKTPAGTGPPAAVTITGLRAVAPPTGPSGHETDPAHLGSLDALVHRERIDFSRAGPGIERLTLSNVWETATANRQARAYYRALADDRAPAGPPPSSDLRYTLLDAPRLTNRYRGDGFDVPVLAAIRVTINGEDVNLFDYNRDEGGEPQYIWAETGAGAFETVVRNDAGEAVLRVTRRFVPDAPFNLTIEQRLENLTGERLVVRWYQYGPGSLRLDRSRYMDRRRYRFGYLPDPLQHPGRDLVLAEDNDLLLERRDLQKRWEKAEEAQAAGDREARLEYLTLWPNKTSLEQGYELSWFGATNRYFGIAVHPTLESTAAGRLDLLDVVEEISMEVSEPGGTGSRQEQQKILTYLKSPEHVIEAGETLALDLGVFAGPLDRHVLSDPAFPYRSLAMNNLILFQMSSFCAICTFQWLAHLLLGFLTVLHDYVVFDWGLAIIGLVVIVRTLLHPITKRSQISMQRFGKVMGTLKPELDKLQKKFPDDPRKLQQEQIRMMREHGANPLQMLGCLPMFLQTPIWIALYAMLYFTFDLRQAPAFFGLFQTLTGGHWGFLADLGAADHFFWEYAEPFRFLMWNVTGINLLPILMGVIFYIQQKYMSPPPSPSMTPEQLQQQKIMKVLMVVMFPLMLYSAPSGLTLYILTSSCIGILESRYVRNHIKEMDLNPPKEKERKKVKPKDAQGRAYASALQRMEDKRRRQRSGPEPRYKKRK